MLFIGGGVGLHLQPHRATRLLSPCSGPIRSTPSRATLLRPLSAVSTVGYVVAPSSRLMRPRPSSQVDAIPTIRWVLTSVPSPEALRRQAGHRQDRRVEHYRRL